MSLTKDQYMYFIYSSQQYKMRKEIESSIGKKYIPGTVLDTGEWKFFTEKSIKSNNGFSDAVIVHEGYLRDCEYIESTSTWEV